MTLRILRHILNLGGFSSEDCGLVAGAFSGDFSLGTGLRLGLEVSL
jgi:hypothetical protein